MSAPQRNRSGALPKGASFGHVASGQIVPPLNYLAIAVTGSRAQRRWARRLMQRAGMKSELYGNIEQLKQRAGMKGGAA